MVVQSVNMIATNLAHAIRKAVAVIDPSDDPIPQIIVQYPSQMQFGDYTTNVALQLAKRQQKSPKQVADLLHAQLESDQELKDSIEKIEVAASGFINFWIRKEILVDSLMSIVKQKHSYGKNEDGKGKKVIVEYSSPNIAKPFTVGHLRSTIIGDAVANLLEASGWEVHRDNHLGDWGTQFGKQIYAIKTWGNENEIENSPSPVKALVELYVKFHSEAEKDPKLEEEARAWFKKLEDGDREARRLWEKCIEWSLKEFDALYKRLGVKFTENEGKGYGESFFEDKMPAVIEELTNKGILKEGEEGAKLVFFEADKYPPLMILKKDGTTLYATRDLAADKFRLETYGSEVVIINEVGAEQTLYFQQIHEVEKMLGWVKEGQRVHIRHGMFRFSDSKMSTRRGNVIWLEDVLTEAVTHAKALGSTDEKLAEQVGIGALKWNELKRDPVADIVFDWKDILNMQGNSGPYLQYTFARTQSVLARGAVGETALANVTFNEEELSVARLLARFSDVIATSAKMYSPSLLATFLFDLAREYNAFYNKHKIIDAPDEEAKKLRLVLTNATGQVLKNGLTLLGIATPQKM